MLSPPPRYPVVLSILAALLTLGMKSVAYYLTGSVGLLSDAAESLVNLLAACTAYLSLWFAARPVDSSHTYGHEKIEYFSSGLEGTLIVIAAGGILWYAVERLITPRELHDLGIGTAISLAASLVNLGVAVVLLRVGRACHSIVLEANGQHLMTDVWTSVGVLGGLFLVWLTDWLILDPLLAILVACNILWTAYDLLKRSFNGLMDHALPESEQAAVRQAIESCLLPSMHYHALRTRQAGARRFVDFHLLVPGIWSVRVAHKLTEQVEEAVRKVLPGGAEVTVHIEPLEDQASWEDSALIAVEQARQQEKT
jgi:cation diffusion facilitator family transporter